MNYLIRLKDGFTFTLSNVADVDMQYEHNSVLFYGYNDEILGIFPLDSVLGMIGNQEAK